MNSKVSSSNPMLPSIANSTKSAIFERSSSAGRLFGASISVIRWCLLILQVIGPKN